MDATKKENLFKKVGKSFKKTWRTALIILVAFSFGLGLLPGIDFATERYNLWREMNTNPAYQVIDDVEALGNEFRILTVEDYATYVVAWVYIDDDAIAAGSRQYATDKEKAAYLDYATYGRLWVTIVALSKHYPNAQIYYVAIGAPGEADTLSGAQPTMATYYIFYTGKEVVQAVAEVECTSCMVIGLLQQGYIKTQSDPFGRVLVYLTSGILPREPGFVWPWE